MIKPNRTEHKPQPHLSPLNEGEVRVRIKTIHTYGDGQLSAISFSGVVEAIGKSANLGWMGQRVGVYPLVPCGVCETCINGHLERCMHEKTIIGTVVEYVNPTIALSEHVNEKNLSALSKYANVPEQNLIVLPDEVSFEQAALLHPLAQAAHIIRSGAPLLDSTILVNGSDELAAFLVMLLKQGGHSNIQVIDDADWDKPSLDKWPIIIDGQTAVLGAVKATFSQGDFSYSGSDDWSHVLQLLMADAIHPEQLVSKKSAFR